MNKLFIIGLPRTGTTSISIAMLDYGFKVAHTAYTKQAFELADVISDSPCFCDYPELDALYPNSKFVYLDRALEQWIPSIQMLLKKMQENLAPKTGIFHPVLKRSFNETFNLYIPPYTKTSKNTLETNKPSTKHTAKNLVLNEMAFTEQHLTECYQTHKEQVLRYFAHREDLLVINLSDKNSLDQLLSFLDVPHESGVQFPHVNIGRHFSCCCVHKFLNIVNTLSSGVDQRKFFDYK